MVVTVTKHGTFFRFPNFVEAYETCTEDHEPMNNHCAAAHCSPAEALAPSFSKDKNPTTFSALLSSHNDELVECE
jgi:hypothetical protein